MSFATVKSDPYKAGLKPQRGRKRHLWTPDQWAELVRRARNDVGKFDPHLWPISDGCVDLIRQFNESLTQ